MSDKIFTMDMVGNTESDGKVIGYHATAVKALVSILKDGLKSQRASRRIYMGTFRGAEYFAKAWGVGLHAIGKASRSDSMLLACRVPAKTVINVVRGHEYSVDLALIPQCDITTPKGYDMSESTEVERAQCLINFYDLLTWELDPYTIDSPYRDYAALAKPIIDAIPVDIREQLEVPNFFGRKNVSDLRVANTI